MLSIKEIRKPFNWWMKFIKNEDVKTLAKAYLNPSGMEIKNGLRLQLTNNPVQYRIYRPSKTKNSYKREYVLWQPIKTNRDYKALMRNLTERPLFSGVFE